MRVATWCIGGINSKLRYLRHWLDERKPDVVALQKTFAATDHFPKEALRQAGYESVVHARDGEFQNGWGVAVLVRETLPKPKILQIGLPGQSDPGARFVTLAVGDLEFSSVYAVYGNPAVNRFEGALKRKIAWMKQLHEHVGKRTNLPRRCVLAGDFNVVSEGPALPKTLNYTSRERDALGDVLRLGLWDLYDLHRRRNPDVGTGFNYGFNTRQPATSRLHRILGTEVVKDQLRDAWVDLEYRKAVKGLPGCAWPQSAPVIVDLSSESI
ncbi:MAG: endonuclease/exonuclease/phosphatase family protein [Bryobacterales bacterium]|nr:endonuclease/exonuclease/phosphatase family protein [Bryobacterales bacterium]MDE0262576.1 endonuclease/exonuclease/phosphatase family protein [Bryobacterales bacterium]